jgi:hypothetical protein
MSSGIRVSGMDNTFSYPFCKYPQISNATRTCTHGYRLIPEPVYNGFFIRGHADNGYPLPSLPAYRLKSKTKSKTYYHMPRSFRPCLPAWEGSGAATCFMAPDPASLFGRAPVLPHVPRLWIMPPCSGGLRCYHVPRGSGPYLPTWEGSNAATCPMTSESASLFGRASTLPHVPRLSTGHRSQE